MERLYSKTYKLNNENDFININSIIDFKDNFFLRINNQKLPNIIIDSFSNKNNEITVHRKKEHEKPYNLDEYRKFFSNLLDIEKDLIAYQIIYTISEIHDLRRIHLNIKPTNILINDMGMIFLCDMGFHIYHKLINISETNEICIERYLKTKREYIEPTRLKKNNLDSNISINESNSSTVSTHLSKYDIFPIMKILEELYSEYKSYSFKKLINYYENAIESIRDDFRFANKLLDVFNESNKNIFIFFKELNFKILNKSWESSEIIEELINGLQQPNSNQNKLKGVENLLLINYLAPSIIQCKDFKLKIKGLEILDQLVIKTKIEESQDAIIYIIERILPLLLDLLNEKNKMSVRMNSLKVFIKIIGKINIRSIEIYEKKHHFEIHYILAQLLKIFSSKYNECLIIYFLDKISIFLSLILQFNEYSIRTILNNYNKFKADKNTTGTVFDIKNKKIRTYEDHNKERLIEKFIQKMIDSLLSFKDDHYNIALIRTLPIISLYLSKVSYMSIITEIFDIRNSVIIVELIKILDNILLFDYKGDFIDKIIENLRDHFNQMKINELLRKIKNMYENEIFSEFPEIEEKLMLGPDNIFKYILNSSRKSYDECKNLIDYLIIRDPIKFYCTVQKNILHLVDKSEYKLLQKIRNYGNENNSIEINESFRQSTRISNSSIDQFQNNLKLHDIQRKFTFYDLNDKIIEMFVRQRDIIIFKESEENSYLKILRVRKDEIFKYIGEYCEDLTINDFRPHFDKKLCCFNQSDFFFLENNSKFIIRFNIDSKKITENFSVEEIKDKILIILLVEDQNMILIITEKKLYKYCLNTKKLEFLHDFSFIKGKIISHDYSFHDKNQVFFGTNMGYLYIFDCMEMIPRSIEISYSKLPIINIKSIAFNSIILQFKSKNSNQLEYYSIDDNKPNLKLNFTVKKSNRNELLFSDINSIYTNFEKNTIFFSGGKDLIYWDYKNQKSINLSSKSTTSKGWIEGNNLIVNETKDSNHPHSYIIKILSITIENKYLIITLHFNSTISIWYN